VGWRLRWRSPIKGGLAALSIAASSPERLGSRADGSLYNPVANRDAIIDGLVEISWSARSPCPEIGGDWKARECGKRAAIGPSGPATPTPWARPWRFSRG